MTCGACEPESFRKHHGGYLIGYAASGLLCSEVRDLYFHGASLVHWDDKEDRGSLFNRKGFKNVLRTSRAGDTVLFSHETDLGDRPSRREKVIKRLEGYGLKVAVLKERQELNKT